jgi:hypothetical protein
MSTYLIIEYGTIGFTLLGMILTVIGIHKNVYKRAQSHALPGEFRKIDNYPNWLQKTKLFYTLFGLLGFGAIIFGSIGTCIKFCHELFGYAFMVSKASEFITILFTFFVGSFTGFILYKGYDAFATEMRLKKYKKMLSEIKSEKNLSENDIDCVNGYIEKVNMILENKDLNNDQLARLKSFMDKYKF